MEGWVDRRKEGWIEGRMVNRRKDGKIERWKNG